MPTQLKDSTLAELERARHEADQAPVELTWTDADPTDNYFARPDRFYAVLSEVKGKRTWMDLDLTTIHNMLPGHPARWAIYIGTTVGCTPKYLREEGGVLRYLTTLPEGTTLEEAKAHAARMVVR